MAKINHFNILMAGLISGIVALTTATLGISGTVIGSVISSILYQVLSSYSEEKISDKNFKDLTNRRDKNYGVSLGGEIVYLLPIIVITIIEVAFVFSSFLYPLAKVFHLLEAATNQNLFRVMGFGMIVLSFFPFLNSNNIRRNTAFLTFITGVIFLFRGFVDSGFILFRVAALVFAYLDFFIGLIILLLLLIIIVQVISAIFTSQNSQNSFRNINKVNPNGNVNSNLKNKVDFSEENYNSSNKSVNASSKTKYFFKDKFDD